jgi:hypothetical protein
MQRDDPLQVTTIIYLGGGGGEEVVEATKYVSHDKAISDPGF